MAAGPVWCGTCGARAAAFCISTVAVCLSGRVAVAGALIVVGVEASATSAADLAANAEAHSLSNVRAVSATAYDFLRRFAQAEPELVVLDPPRAGVGMNVLELLVASRPQLIHYVSCSPPTLARDLGYLVERGYRLDSVELFDFFPQTFHIECLVRLIRHDGTSR